jgi:hypothetical protein
MAADGLGHDGAYADPQMGEAGFGEVGFGEAGPDTATAADLGGWDLQPGSYADQDGEPTPYAQQQYSDFPADEMLAEAGTPSVYGNETEAWPASGYATGADTGLDADVDWQGGQQAQAGYGLAIPDAGGPSVGAVAIPGFDQP